MLQLWFVANTLLWTFNIEFSGLKLGLNVILLTLFGMAWIIKEQRVTTQSIKVLSGFVFFLLFSFLVATTGTCTDKFQKFIFTAPALFFLILIAWEIGWRATDDDWLKLEGVASWVLVIAFLELIIEMMFPASFPYKLGYQSEGKFSGFFSEPSHVAFSLFPSVLILLVAESKKVQIRGIVALGAFVYLSRSSTLIGLIVARMLYQLPLERNLSRGLLIILGMSLIVVLGAVLNYDSIVAPTLERVAGITAADSTGNLSSLVYVQGWQDAWANLLRTNGLGLGFNMMGCDPLPAVPARVVMDEEYTIGLNTEDGSFVLSKLISETGVIGIMLFALIIWWWIRVEEMIRKLGDGKKKYAASIQIALIFSFIATALLRSSGYFSGGLLMLVVAIAATVKRSKHNTTKA